MNKVLLIISLYCCVFLHAGIACSADRTAGSNFLISSVPNGAGVFHYLRGKNYFLGYTPLKINRKDLDEKNNVRIRLIKFGYGEALLDMDVDGKDKIFSLDREKQPYIKKQGKITNKLTKCGSAVEKQITDTVRNNITSQLALQLPFFLAETGKGVEIRIMASILNHNDIHSIKKIWRKDNDETIAYVERLVSPVASRFINAFDKLNCLDVVVIVAAYQNKGLKVDFTPYVDHWSEYTERIVGDKKYTTIYYGTKVEQYSGMVQTSKEKSFLFEYRLH